MTKSATFLINRSSPPEDKISLFRSYFRGRDDVYARRFESRKTGKSGYSPACANEWVRGVCDKRNFKCAKCPNRQFMPVSSEVIHQHLTGMDDSGCPFVLGVYPMLFDETCFFLAMDFDKKNWAKDVKAVLKTCRELELPVLAERSRSGCGAHLWFFFDKALPATIARKMGALILTLTLERRPEIGLQSYDRLFPNQETMPETSGKFELNARLPIQFAGRSFLEADFYCKETHLIIELDGHQHLESLEAYRLDRRKDVVLQENGFFVLRFLTEDICKNLNNILDTIIRIQAHLQNVNGV